MKSLSPVRLFMTPWTVAHQAPPSMEFSRQEYWSGLPFPSLTISIIIFNISGGTIPVKGKCLLIDKKTRYNYMLSKNSKYRYTNWLN